MATRVVEPATEPELRPVPASVFDDDFFQVSPARGMTTYSVAEEAVRVDAGLRETSYLPVQEPAQREMAVSHEVGVRSTFAAANPINVDAAEPDELDIPAFLRRGH